TLSVGNSSALGSGPLSLSNGTLQANAAVVFSNSLTFPGSGAVGFGGNQALTFNNHLAANDTLTGTTDLIVNVPTTINDSLGGTGALTLLSGTSTLTLGGTN